MDIRTRKYHLVVFLALSPIGFQFFHFFIPWVLGREILVNAISIYFTFSSLSDPQAWDKGEIVQFLGTKPQISQKQDFSGVCDIFYRMRNQILMKKKSASKKFIVLPRLHSDRRNLRDLPIKAPIGWKKLLTNFFSRYCISSTLLLKSKC